MLTIDGSQVIAFGRQLRNVPKEIRPKLRQSIIESAEVVAGQARANASWSSRIPGAIKTRVRFGSTNAVQIVVDAKRAPHARPFEGIGQRGGSFRHPVFGRDVWVSQSQRPFLVPAVRANEERAVRGIQQAIESAFDGLG